MSKVPFREVYKPRDSRCPICNPPKDIKDIIREAKEEIRRPAIRTSEEE